MNFFINFLQDVHRNGCLNFPVIAFMKIHGNIPENSWFFMAHLWKCYMVIEGNSAGTFYSDKKSILDLKKTFFSEKTANI